MFGIFANDHYFALAFNHFALFTHGLNGRSYFHIKHPFLRRRINLGVALITPRR